MTITGTVTSLDHPDKDFSLQLNMQREYTSEETINIKAKDGAINDPLVINFPGTAADLSCSKFTFDLEPDGEDNTISLLKLGSGFLALDKNNDGTVSNISEFFGPYTGDGFLELAAYDEDGNNWIDENDSIFEKIRIWTNDTEGNDSLNTLISHGVGAIYLANLTSPFTVKDSENNTAGQIANTGIYLNEDGTPGVLQQVNIVT